MSQVQCDWNHHLFWSWAIRPDQRGTQQSLAVAKAACPHGRGPVGDEDGGVAGEEGEHGGGGLSWVRARWCPRPRRAEAPGIAGKSHRDLVTNVRPDPTVAYMIRSGRSALANAVWQRGRILPSDTSHH